MYNISFETQAEMQLIEQFIYYEQQSVGLGNDFLNEYEHLLKYISVNPFGFQKKYSEFRMGTIKRFPFGVFYLINEIENIILVVAILNQKSNPKINWKFLKH